MADITALIADDEPELVRHLERLLNDQWPELRVVARAHDGREAVDALKLYQPDIVFLDIRMPGLDGMAVAKTISHACHLVFVTAYDEYAVDAFEREALDYLLKPVRPARLERTIARLRNSRGETTPDWQAVLHQLAQGAYGAPSPLSWLRVAHGDQVLILSVDDVVYFQASDKYTSVVTDDAEYLLRTPIRELAETLDPEHFWRIHRRTIVNMAHVAAAEREFGGRMLLRLQTRSEPLRVSRRYAHQFRQL